MTDSVTVDPSDRYVYVETTATVAAWTIPFSITIVSMGNKIVTNVHR